MSQIAVVGAHGLIGSKIVRELGDKTLSVSRNFTLLGSSKTVLWAAGTSNGRMSLSDAEKAFQEMYQSLNQVEFKSLNRFILISSGGAVYGSNCSGAVFETTSLKPISPYASLKVKIENEVRERCQRYGTGLDILRLANVYSDSGHGLVSKILKENVKCLSIRLFASLNSKKQYGSVDDYARIIASFAKKESARDQVRIFNLFPSHVYSIQQIIELFSPYKRIELKNASDLSQIPEETVILDTIHSEFENESESWLTLETYLKNYYEGLNR